MMFHAVGHRPRTVQRLRLGAKPDGKLVSLQHDYVNATSILDDYEENCGEATPHMYSVPNLRVTSGLAKRNIGTPTSMRGPVRCRACSRLNSAMDELAVKLGMDPVQLRLLNEPSSTRARPAVLVAPPPGMPDRSAPRSSAGPGAIRRSARCSATA